MKFLFNARSTEMEDFIFYLEHEESLHFSLLEVDILHERKSVS